MSEQPSLAVNPEALELLHAPVNEGDRHWLETWGLAWNATEDPTWLASFNDLVARGSIHIDGGMEEPAVEGIIDAREQFLTLCTNIAPETINGLRDFNRTLTPLSTIVATQRIFTAEGINNLIVNERPLLLVRGPEGLTSTINFLRNIGVNIPEATQKFPAILTYSAEGLEQKVDALNFLGDKSVAVINKVPGILALGSETIQGRVRHLSQCGLDVPKAISTLPGLLQLPPDTISAKLNELKDMGVNIQIINDNPMILGYGTEAIAQKIQNLETLGIDVFKVITSLPECLSYAPEAVRDKVSNITRLGLDAIKVINKHPDILYYPKEAITAKVSNLLRLGISLKAIERGPAIINFDEETVKTKLADIAELGLDAKKTVNSHPAILNLARDNIVEKLDALTDFGLDALKTVEAKPGILALTPENVRSKLLLLESAGRAWGWQETRGHVARIVQEWPVILTYSPGKLRTLIRVASETFEPMTAESVSKTQVTGLVKNNLEQSVVVYLNHRKEVIAPKDIVRIAKAYKHLEKSTLRAIIFEDADDPVAKMYRKSYPSAA